MKTSPHLRDYRAPGGRTAPSEVVALLREVDPRAELLYAGKGRWMLGTVKHDKELRAQAVRAVSAYLTVLTHAVVGAGSHVEGAGSALRLTPENRRELNFRLWKKLLQVQGFREVCIFRQNMPDSHFADVFRAGDWIMKNKAAADAVEAAAIDKAEGDPELAAKQAAVQEFMAQEGRSLHRHIFRNRSVVQKDVDGFEKSHAN